MKKTARNALIAADLQAMWTRFFPAVFELRKQISEGAIGEVKFMHGDILSCCG